MARSDREAAVAEIVEAFRGSSAAVLTEYRGLTVSEIDGAPAFDGHFGALRDREEHADQDRRASRPA